MSVFAAKVITSSGQPFTARHHAKMFIACLSYANLCFLNEWTALSDRQYDLMRKYSVTWQKVLAVSLDILIVALVVWGVLYLALKTGKKLWIRTVKWGALTALLLPLNIIRNDDNVVSMRRALSNAPALQTLIVLVAVAIGLVLLLNWERLSTRIASSLLILLSPGMPLALANASWQVWTASPGGAFPNKPLQPPLPRRAGTPHVIWVIFDEWDQALTFPDRPAGLSLPEVDRFRSESFHATRVYPPAWHTIFSVPSLLTGKVFIDFSEDQSPDNLMLVYDRNQPPVALNTQSTIFSEARSRGFNVGIAGWYMPYCRMIPDCTACSWSPNSFASLSEDFEHPSVFGSMWRTIARQARKGLKRVGINSEDPLQKEVHAASYREVHDDMLRLVTDPSLSMIFVHIGVPHWPAIYFASGDTISTDTNTTYADNLRLVDRTIRDLRQTLEQAHMWDDSIVLLTADHPLRVADWPQGPHVKQHAKVPYLLKMSGQRQGLAYDRPMQEVVTKDLLLAILGREVEAPDQVAAWLDHNPPRK